MRVLGVDPGLTRCGLGVVDGLPGRKVRMVAVGVAQSAPTADIDQRLLLIAGQIDEWLEEHAPDALAVERVFAQHNVSTVMGTAQVAGIAMLAAARRRIPVAMHTPSEVKAAVTGNGRAEKIQVQTMVARLLSLDTLYVDNAATGIAAALDRAPDVVLVTSGSVASQVARRMTPLDPHTRIACIGPATAEAAREAGLPVHVVGRSRSAEALLDAVVETLPTEAPEAPRSGRSS